MKLDGWVPPVIVGIAMVILIAWRQFHLRGRKQASPALDLTLVVVLIAIAGFLEWRMAGPTVVGDGLQTVPASARP